MSSPKVSIIIPSYNHRPFIGPLIMSVYAQTYKDFELIVLDDGSKDGSPELLQTLSDKFGFQLVLKANEGLCITLNKGLASARGEFIITIGSDDILTEERVQEQVEYLEKHPEVDIVGGSMYLIGEDGKLCGKRSPAKQGNLTFHDMIQLNRVMAPTAMIRARVFKQFGFYPDNYLMEDYQLWLKVLKGGGVIHNTSRFWVYYRINNQNLEKKFNWYYRGAVESISPYQNEPAVPGQLRKLRIIFLIKVALLLGNKFKQKYADVFNELGLIGKIGISLISYLPEMLRDKVLILLKLKV